MMLRWYIATLLFIATLINYLDRQTLSLLAPDLRQTFGFSNTGYSRMIFAFLFAYMIMQPALGRLMDRLGTRKGFSISIAFWSFAAMLHGLANSALFFECARFLLGLGEAGNWPGAVKAVAEWFPLEQRAGATGYFNSGSIAGALIAPLTVPWIALRFGWRAAFMVTGALGSLWLIPWLLIYPTPQKMARSMLRLQVEQAREPGSHGPINWRDLLKGRDVWSLVGARMFADPVWWFYVFWLPAYLKDARKFTTASIAHLAWIPFLTAGIGSLAGGAASDFLVRRGFAILSARKAVMAVAVTGMLAGIPAVFAANSTMTLSMISTATFGFCAWAANMFALPADILPADIVASTSGITGTGAALAGMIFTLATGFAVDHFSYVPVFLAAGLMPVMAVTILYWGLRKEHIPELVYAEGGFHDEK
ncbi:MAG: MFS transporter [Acidobacteriaceae bacterium]|nr:MFS transporter [Acidobacteriaceae bacterium]